MKFLDGAIETWKLTYDDYAFIEQQPRSSRLDLAVKLLSYRAFGRFFPYSEIDDGIVHWVGDQLSLKPSEANAPIYSIRTDRRRRNLITDHLAITEHTQDDLSRLQAFLSSKPDFAAMNYGELEAIMLKWCVDNAVTVPPSKWMQRAHETLRNKVDQAIYASFTRSLDAEARTVLLASIAGEGAYPSLLQMRQATGSTSRDTFYVMAQRVAFTNQLGVMPS